MSNVIQFANFVARFVDDDTWREVLSVDGESSSLGVHCNVQTHELEVVLTNSSDEAIRMVLTRGDVDRLVQQLQRHGYEVKE